MVFGPYPAVVTAIHDGDTITANLDLGFGTHQVELRARLYGINAPELATAAGKDALAYLKTQIKTGDLIYVTSHGWDKYGGRYDAEIVRASDGVNLNQLMVSSGHAVVMV